MKPRDKVLAAGLGAALALAAIFRQVGRNEKALEAVRKSLALPTALGVEMVHLLTDGKVPDDVQVEIYGEVVY